MGYIILNKKKIEEKREKEEILVNFSYFLKNKRTFFEKKKLYFFKYKCKNRKEKYIFMRSSRAEIKIEEILSDAGLNFKEEYSFPDLIGQGGHALRFDFAVFDDDDELEFLI